MPIIVMQRRSPKIACVTAIHIPPVRSQMMFIRMYRHPFALTCTLVSLPKGHNASEAIFSVCRPKGIPTMVMNKKMLPMKYSIAIIMPPNRSQMRFPRIFMDYSSIRFLSLGYLTEYVRISCFDSPGLMATSHVTKPFPWLYFPPESSTASTSMLLLDETGI